MNSQPQVIFREGVKASRAALWPSARAGAIIHSMDIHSRSKYRLHGDQLIRESSPPSTTLTATVSPEYASTAGRDSGTIKKRHLGWESRMSNDECVMNDELRMTKTRSPGFRISTFGLLSTFVIRHSSFAADLRVNVAGDFLHIFGF